MPDRIASISPDAMGVGFTLKKFPKGALVSVPRDSRNSVFIVESGRLSVYVSGDNRDLTLSILEQGDIYTTHTPTYVRTLTSAALWMTDTRSFVARLAENPSVAPTMMRVLGRLLANAVGLIEDIAFREVPARLARFLLGQAERRGVPCDGGWLLSLDFGMEDIASLLGTTRQTVSAVISEWERSGILHRQGRRSLILHSLDAIRAYCP
jgi:CRP-like cAMP-binding protein